MLTQKQNLSVCCSEPSQYQIFTIQLSSLCSDCCATAKKTHQNNSLSLTWHNLSEMCQPWSYDIKVSRLQMQCRWLLGWLWVCAPPHGCMFPDLWNPGNTPAYTFFFLQFPFIFLCFNNWICSFCVINILCVCMLSEILGFCSQSLHWLKAE